MDKLSIKLTKKKREKQTKNANWQKEYTDRKTDRQEKERKSAL